MRVRTEKRRALILQKAKEVFLEMGYERASMLEIASRAGCSKPTIYNYFPSKVDLFLDVLIERIAKGAQTAFLELSSRIQEEPRAVLIDLGEQHIRSISHPEAAGFKRLIAASMTAEADIQLFWEIAYKKALLIIEDYLRAITEAGHLRPLNARLAAQQLLSLYEAEVNWGGPIGHASIWTSAMIRQASMRAVDMFLAFYGCKEQDDDE